MKKLLSVLLIFAFLFTASFACADDYDLAYKRLGELETFSGATASGDLDVIYDASADQVKTVSATTGPTRSGDLTFQTNLLAMGRINAFSTVASSSTNIAPTSLPYLVLGKSICGAGGLDADPGTTLPNGTDGQVLILLARAMMDGGSWKVTPTTCTGFSYVTLDTKGDSITLCYVDSTLGWVIIGNNGTTVTTPDIKQGL